jgi:hypothetical protein
VTSVRSRLVKGLSSTWQWTSTKAAQTTYARKPRLVFVKAPSPSQSLGPVSRHMWPHLDVEHRADVPSRRRVVHDVQQGEGDSLRQLLSSTQPASLRLVLYPTLSRAVC